MAQQTGCNEYSGMSSKAVPEMFAIFLAMACPACNESGPATVQGAPGIADDRQPPAIVAVHPHDGEAGVIPGGEISVEFNERIADTEATLSALTVSDASGPVVGDTFVNMSRLVFRPRDGLLYDHQYAASLKPGVQDLVGNSTTRGEQWTFRTLNPQCPSPTLKGLSLIEGKTVAKPVTGLPKPAKGVRYVDPVHGTCVVRATDHETEPPSGFARNDYSRRQAFNADGSMFLIYAYDGYWHVYNAENLSYIRRLDMGGSEVEPQWHPDDPETLYIFPHNGGMSIRKYNVLDDATEVVADFDNVSSIAGYPGATSVRDIWPNAARLWTKSEGSPSADARYWGLMVDTGNFEGLGLVTYDLQTNTITGVYDYMTDGNGIGRPDHVSMSPSGKYVVSSWYVQDCPDNSRLGTLTAPCGLMSFARDFSSARGLASRGEHSDIALDENRNDVVVMPDYETGYVEMYSLETGAATRLWNIYINGAATAMHVSGKNFAKPGWVLISTYGAQNPNGASLWYKDRIFAVELKPNPRIYHIAHTYNVTDQYFSEPHAVVNREFTRILYNSNWNSGDFRDIDAYMITLPASAIPDN